MQIKVDYIQHTGDATTVASAARVSFGNAVTKLEDKDKKLIKYLADHKHMSPFEHCFLTIKISCPLYIRSQIHRHRTFSYNEISRRYTSKDMEFYVPKQLRKQHVSNRQASEGELEPYISDTALMVINQQHNYSLRAYNSLIAAGVCKEQARGVLSQDLMTEFYMSGNLRNYAHFVDLRQHAGAQFEVQVIADDVKKLLIDKFGYAAEVLFGEEK